MPFDKTIRPPMPEGKGLFGPKEEIPKGVPMEEPSPDAMGAGVPGLEELGAKYGLTPEEVESFIQDLGDLLAQAGPAAGPAAGPMGPAGPAPAGPPMGPKGPVMG